MKKTLIAAALVFAGLSSVQAAGIQRDGVGAAECAGTQLLLIEKLQKDSRTLSGTDLAYIENIKRIGEIALTYFKKLADKNLGQGDAALIYNKYVFDNRATVMKVGFTTPSLADDSKVCAQWFLQENTAK
jgi:hypothetical protein